MELFRHIDGRTLASGGLSGLLLAAATAQVGLGPLCFVALVPLLIRIDAGAPPSQAAVAGGLGGVLFFGCALGWVPAVGLGVALVPVLAVYVLALASTWAIFAASLAWLRARDRTAFFVAGPLLWIVLEYLRAVGSFGYPWHHLGYALADHAWLVQLAALGGVHAVSLWIVAVNASLIGVYAGGALTRVTACVLVLAPLSLGARATMGAVEPEAEAFSIAAIQPAAATSAGTDRASFAARLRDLVELSDRAVRGAAPDLLVWPESAYGAVVPPVGDPFLGSLALHYERPLLVGARRVARGTLYNSALLAEPDGSTRVAGDKVHPVPVFERAPVSVLGRALAYLGIWRGRLHPGERAGVVDAGAATIGILICFDSSYPELARDLRGRGARLLVEISNEAPSGGWTARQHARVSRLRAIETGLPLVRVSNTGPSEWVDARGRVRASLPLGETGWKSVSLELSESAPPFVRFGSAPAFTAGLLPLIPLVLRRRTWRSRVPVERIQPKGDPACPVF